MNITYKNNQLNEKEKVVLTKKGDIIEISQTTKEGTPVIDSLDASLFVEKGRSIFANRSSFEAIYVEESLQIVRYVNLHARSGFSILKSITRISELVEKAETSVALTDDGNMFGTLEFYKKMKSAKKKPIIGFQAFVESSYEKEATGLILLSKNERGFKNLMKLTSIGYQNFNELLERPVIMKDELKKYSSDIVALSGSFDNELGKSILNKDMDKAYQIVEEMISIFGKENYFIEIQRHNIWQEKELNPALIKIAKKYDLKLIATPNSYYTNEEDKDNHDVHLSIGEKELLTNSTRFQLHGDNYHFLTSQEMVELFSDIPEALDNSLDLAELLNTDIKTGVNYMPRFEIPVPFTNEMEYLRHLVQKGFEKRFPANSKERNSSEYKERIEFELSVIEKMGFEGYFLIVSDFVKWAKDNDILVGPGRGSACGSEITYCLGITNIDPIPFGLLFERFLNPDRKSMPDIDIDFPDNRREEVLNYVRQKYGMDAVSGIITFGTLKSKSVVRDVARVLGHEASFGNHIAKLIPEKMKPKETLVDVLKNDYEFSTLYHSDDDAKKVIDIGIKLEGLPRNISQHACGYLISPSAVSNYIPQATVPNNETGLRDTVTQFNMSECEEMGILKMDFLGLRILGAFDRALKDINKNRKTKLELDSISRNDINVYDFISKGNTAGVFQLESPGMTALMSQLYQDIQRMKGTEEDGKEMFERLVAGISLYRPGPIEEIPNYIHNMLNTNTITYELKELEQYLSPTYNVIVYQEQVMFIVRELAGFSKSQADDIRKAMGKKKVDIINEYEEYFVNGSKELNIKGCVANGIQPELAKNLWERMRKFAEYAFNKSHAVGYSDISVRSGWLSYYFPTEYLTATLNSYIKDADRIKQFMSVCKSRKIKILPPDINNSEQFFSVEGKAIRFGLSGVRNMGTSGLLIIEEREANGAFKSVYDFIKRMALNKKINKRMLEALIFSGALDSFEGNRQEKLNIIEKMVELAKISKEDKKMNINNLLGLSMFKPMIDNVLKIKKAKEISDQEKFEAERRFTGFYVTGHPLDQYRHILTNPSITDLYPISRILPFSEEDEEEVISDDEGTKLAVQEDFTGKTVRIAGVIQDVKTFTTKVGTQMSQFTIEDVSSTVRAVLFPKVYARFAKEIKNEAILSFTGVLEVNERGTQFIILNIEQISELLVENEIKEIQLTLSDDMTEAQEEFAEIVKIFERKKTVKFENVIPVVVSIAGKEYRTRGGIPLKGNVRLATIQSLSELLGKNNVKVIY